MGWKPLLGHLLPVKHEPVAVTLHMLSRILLRGCTIGDEIQKMATAAVVAAVAPGGDVEGRNQ